jgi:CheY-like chemotaxis protein
MEHVAERLKSDPRTKHIPLIALVELANTKTLALCCPANNSAVSSHVRLAELFLIDCCPLLRRDPRR